MRVTLPLKSAREESALTLRKMFAYFGSLVFVMVNTFCLVFYATCLRSIFIHVESSMRLVVLSGLADKIPSPGLLGSAHFYFFRFAVHWGDYTSSVGSLCRLLHVSGAISLNKFLSLCCYCSYHFALADRHLTLNCIERA